MAKKRLILAANRLPVTVSESEETGELQFKSSPGGLVTGLSALKDKYEQSWVGWPGELDLETADLDAVSDKLRKEFSATPVFLTKAQLNRYYYGFSNKVLWPIFHYLPSHCDYDAKDWRAYVEVNEMFAEKLVRELEANREAPVWVHDYQLMLVPHMVRERIPEARIGFFLHTPFPSSEMFRAVPHKSDLLRGLLGANLIGFHTYGYLRHFRSCLLRILGINSDISGLETETHSVQFGVHPISVDTKKIRTILSSEQHEEDRKLPHKVAAGRKIILGVDRLDYTKGLSYRLRGVKKFFDARPERAEDYVFVQIAVPSRRKIFSYRELKEEVDDLVGSINEDYEDATHPPVQYYYRSFPFEKLAAFYDEAEIALITPLCDGMNLVAKEFVAAKKDNGVLILSELAGASSELGESILVNPWNPDEIAEALEEALNMPTKVRSKRMKAMFEKVRKNDVHNWANSYLRKLENVPVQLETTTHSTTQVTSKVRASILESYRKAKNPLLVFDYDGTLTEFTKIPANARPDKQLLEDLRALQGTVAVVSGRSRDDLLEWLGELPLILSAEHGRWVRWPQGEWAVKGPEDKPEWFEGVREILEQFTGDTPGSFIEEKEAALAWHYRQTDPEFGSSQARELAMTLSNSVANTPAEVVSGKSVVEVRFAGVHKGNIIQELIGDTNERYDFILVVGDDTTDEDMFQAAPEGSYAIKVGKGTTKATYRLKDVKEVRSLLRSLAEAA